MPPNQMITTEDIRRIVSEVIKESETRQGERFDSIAEMLDRVTLDAQRSKERLVALESWRHDVVDLFMSRAWQSKFAVFAALLSLACSIILAMWR